MSTDLQFSSCESQKCHNVPITNDVMVELVESFFVSLEKTDDAHDRIIIAREFALKEVTIVDDDGK